MVRVVREGESLARQTGLLDSRGRPVRGLPPHIISAGVAEAGPRGVGHFLRMVHSLSQDAHRRLK